MSCKWQTLMTFKKRKRRRIRKRKVNILKGGYK
jgi:hypothetical protein